MAHGMSCCTGLTSDDCPADGTTDTGSTNCKTEKLPLDDCCFAESREPRKIRRSSSSVRVKVNRAWHKQIPACDLSHCFGSGSCTACCGILLEFLLGNALPDCIPGIASRHDARLDVKCRLQRVHPHMHNPSILPPRRSSTRHRPSPPPPTHTPSTTNPPGRPFLRTAACGGSRLPGSWCTWRWYRVVRLATLCCSRKNQLPRSCPVVGLGFDQVLAHRLRSTRASASRQSGAGPGWHSSRNRHLVRRRPCLARNSTPR